MSLFKKLKFTIGLKTGLKVHKQIAPTCALCWRSFWEDMSRACTIMYVDGKNSFYGCLRFLLVLAWNPSFSWFSSKYG